jgi:hypothetical protein
LITLARTQRGSGLAREIGSMPTIQLREEIKPKIRLERKFVFHSGSRKEESEAIPFVKKTSSG